MCLRLTHPRPGERHSKKSEQKQNECSGEVLVKKEFQEANPYSKTTNSTKSCLGGSKYTCTDLDEITYENNSKIKDFSPCSDPDNKENIVDYDVNLKEQNLALYRDSGKTVHLAKPVPISDSEEQGNDKSVQIIDCPASRPNKESEQKQNECSGGMLAVEEFQEANPYSKTTKCSDKTIDGFLNNIVEYLETSACQLSRHTETYWFRVCDGNALSSTKANVGEPIPTCTQVGEGAYEQELNKGDLIEFRKHHPESKESKAHKDVDLKAQSHWAVYLGSGTIAGPNTPYCVSYHINHGTNTLKVVYPTKEQDNNTDLKLKDSDELKSIVRSDELFHIAKVENAEPNQDNQMDEINTPKAVYPTKEQDNNTDLKLKDSEELKTNVRIGEHVQDANVQNAEPNQDNQMDEINTPKAVYPIKEQDNNAALKLKDSDELKTNMTIDEQFQVTNVQNEELCQTNQMDEMFNLTKSGVGGTVNACTQLDVRTSEQELKKGDLIEFRPLHSLTSLYPPYSYPDNKESRVYKDDAKAQSHWALYLGSGTIAGPNTPCRIIVPKDIPTTDQRKIILIVVCPTKEKDSNTDRNLIESDELKTTVRMDELFKIANIQKSEPNQSNKMDEINTPKAVYPTEKQDTNTDLKLKDSEELTTNVRISEHVQGANVQNAEPYQVNQMDEINTLKVVYPTKEQDNNIDLKLKDSEELKTNVTIGEHVQDANVQNAEPYQVNQMDEINTPKAVYPTKEEDNNADLNLKDYDEIQRNMRRDGQFQVPKVQDAELCQTNQMDEIFNSQKSIVGGTVNTCTQVDERTEKQVFNKGDLIEFRPYNSLTSRYPPCSYPDRKESKAHKYVDREAQSHWAVYLGSGEIAHVAGPNAPYCVNVLREIPTINQTMSILKTVCPKEKKDNISDLKLENSDDLKPIVRKDDLYQVAKIQKAAPYANNKMDEMFIAGTPDEIVNVAKYLVGKALPHDFITKDCKDFAVFCRYGENLRILKEIQQPNQLMNKNRFKMILGVVIAFVALVFGKMF